MSSPAYFAAVRASLFNGRMGAKQIEGQTLIISEWGGTDRQLAYVLATVFHETAHTMQPIPERGQRSYFAKYEPGTRIGKMLGNTRKGDGYLFRGRGFVQLTGRVNYAKMGKRLGVDLENTPDLALKPGIAVQCLIMGMTEGMFTGKKLSAYITASRADYVNARRVVNGTDRAGLIAGYAEKFEAALQASAVPVDRPKPVEPVPVPALGYDREEVRVFQRLLLGHGYVTVGGVDGLVGDSTRSVVRDFRAANSLPEGEHLDDDLLAALKRPDAIRPVIMPDRANATLSDLRDKDSEIVKGTDWQKVGTAGAAAGTAVKPVSDIFTDSGEEVSGFVDTLTPFQSFIAFFSEGAWVEWIWVPVLIIVGIVGWKAFAIARARLWDHRLNNTAIVNLKQT